MCHLIFTYRYSTLINLRARINIINTNNLGLVRSKAFFNFSSYISVTDSETIIYYCNLFRPTLFAVEKNIVLVGSALTWLVGILIVR